MNESVEKLTNPFLKLAELHLDEGPRCTFFLEPTGSSRDPDEETRVVGVLQDRRMRGDGDQKERRRRTGEGEWDMRQTSTPRTPAQVRSSRRMTNTVQVEKRGSENAIGR